MVRYNTISLQLQGYQKDMGIMLPELAYTATHFLQINDAPYKRTEQCTLPQPLLYPLTGQIFEKTAMTYKNTYYTMGSHNNLIFLQNWWPVRVQYFDV